MFKNSNYLVSTSINEDTEIFFSTRTGSSIAVDFDTANIIRNEDYDKLSDHHYSKLVSYEMVVPKEENELEEIINYNKRSAEANTTLYQIIQPTANCQLGCHYCGQTHTKHQIKDNYMDKVVERLSHKLSDGKYNHLHIGWFGAEPLMGLTAIKNYSSKLNTIAAKSSASYSAKMVTNGLSLKKKVFLDLVENCNVNFFEVTLDGTAEYHDKRRHLKSGGESYDLILKNLVDIFNLPNYEELNVTFNIRCNVDESNYEGVLPLIDKLADLGIHKKISNFYVAPIHSWGNDAHKAALETSEFADKEINWLIYLIEKGFKVGILPSRKTETCMVVSPDAELIDAYGNIYNCSEVSYVPGYENKNYNLGNINFIKIDETFENKPFSDWYDSIRNNTSNSPCHSCEILPVCGGSCPKTWSEGIFSCPPIKFNLQDRMALTYLIAQKGIEVFQSTV